MKNMKDEKEELIRAEAWCSAAERCRSEAFARLSRCDRNGESLPEDAVARIIAHLEKEGYIDERRYAEAFVHDKLRFSKWGRIRIAMALRQKGIGHDVFDDILNAVDMDDYIAVLRGLIAAKKRGLRAASDYEMTAKLLRFAASRGFEPSLAGEIIDELKD